MPAAGDAFAAAGDAFAAAGDAFAAAGDAFAAAGDAFAAAGDALPATVAFFAAALGAVLSCEPPDGGALRAVPPWPACGADDPDFTGAAAGFVLRAVALDAIEPV
ncbi:MAG: hypothetical protein FGM37_05980 [Phycisphaerales bacterium]|nr:hypothetical protein [Phycisphaerales bacterium]